MWSCWCQKSLETAIIATACFDQHVLNATIKKGSFYKPIPFQRGMLGIDRVTPLCQIYAPVCL